MNIHYHIIINYTEKQRTILEKNFNVSKYDFGEPIESHKHGLLINEDVSLSDIQKVLKLKDNSFLKFLNPYTDRKILMILRPHVRMRTKKSCKCECKHQE